MPLALLGKNVPKHTAQSFVTQVIEPVLCRLTEIPFSAAAAQLLLGTALHESGGLKFRRQLGSGPARGLFQMEPATHNDLWKNFLAFKKPLAAEVEALLSAPGADKVAELETNDNYAAAMARVHYWRAPAALPKAGNTTGQATYWKRYYNTPLGKGTPKKYLDDYALHGGGAVTFRSSCP
ncbi:hypothetical protein [Mangrovicoccus sp. HB161399]|uniref:hypothetical protein n=1 Tax=Mangrovicoccus sp. HB161399 TaxID=2720392 RepID=UPI001C12E7E8|nr:hypothetical protein [Mangrovicoccus sp. HB161399]